METDVSLFSFVVCVQNNTTVGSNPSKALLDIDFTSERRLLSCYHGYHLITTFVSLLKSSLCHGDWCWEPPLAFEFPCKDGGELLARLQQMFENCPFLVPVIDEKLCFLSVEHRVISQHWYTCSQNSHVFETHVVGCCSCCDCCFHA